MTTYLGKNTTSTTAKSCINTSLSGFDDSPPILWPMPSWMACCSSEVGFCKQPNGLVLHCSDYENSWIMSALLLTTTSPGPFTHNKEIGVSAFSIFSPQSLTCTYSGALWLQKLQSPPLRTQGWQMFFPLNKAWSKSAYSHACFTHYQDFHFLVIISHFLIHLPSFSLNHYVLAHRIK